MGVYQIETLNNEIKRNIFEEGYFTESNSPFTIKPNFLTLGSIKEISSNIVGSQMAFTPTDSIKDLLGLKSKIKHGENNLSHYPVDILSFDNNFIETDIAQGLIFKNKRSRVIHNFAMYVDPGYEYTEKFRGGVQWYMMESKDFVLFIRFEFKNGSNQLVFHDGQSIPFRLSIKEV